MNDRSETPAVVLIVEDESSILTMLTRTLETEGYVVTGTGQCEAVPLLLARAVPCVILMDLMLRGQSGFELSEAVRPAYAGPIIAMSASSLLCREARRWPHFSCVVPKPYDTDELLALIAGYAAPQPAPRAA